MLPLECHPSALEVIQAFRSDILSNIAIALSAPETLTLPNDIVIVSADKVVPDAVQVRIPLFAANSLIVLASRQPSCWLIFFARPMPNARQVLSDSEIDEAQNFHIELLDLLEGLDKI